MSSATASEVAGGRAPTDVRVVGQLGLGSPLTERVLGRLGSPRWLWTALWASLAVIAPIVLLSVLNLSGESAPNPNVSDLLISQAVLAYAVGLAIWGIGRLMRDTRALEPHLVRLTQAETPFHPLAGTGTVAAPILMTAAVSIVNMAGSLVRYGALPTVLVMPFLALSLLPVMTFVWTYLQLLVGLDRLGRARLALDLFPQDRSLGLSGIGSLAFSGFVILFAAAIPIFVTTSANLATVAVSLSLVGVSTSMFFLSMWRVHRQMVAAKEGYIAQTRDLYAEVYAPLRVTPTAEALAAQATALTAAQGILERAERIREWPVDEAMTAWVAIIVTGVVTSLIGRLVLGAAGL